MSEGEIKIKNVVYIISQPFCRRNYDRFGVDTWLKRGWNVEIWDLTQFLYPGMYKDFAQREREYSDYKNNIRIKSVKEFMRVVKKSDPFMYYIDLLGDGLMQVILRRYLAWNGVKNIITRLGSIPSPMPPQGCDAHPEAKAKIRINPVYVVEYLRKVAYMFLMVINKEPYCAIVGGSISLKGLQDLTQIIPAHNLDYDIFLRIKNKNSFKDTLYNMV